MGRSLDYNGNHPWTTGTILIKFKPPHKLGLIGRSLDSTLVTLETLETPETLETLETPETPETPETLETPNLRREPETLCGFAAL